VTDPDDAYLPREARARIKIDQLLRAAGWIVQHANQANVAAGPGVAVREFTLEQDHGRVDYLLFLDGQPAGVIEAKPEGITLVEVEHQSGKYVTGLPAWMEPLAYPLPFIYESTGTETRFTNGYDPDARSRRVFQLPSARDPGRVGPTNHRQPRGADLPGPAPNDARAGQSPAVGGPGDRDPQP
jgi:type I restriction enzyme R subunit